jgi:3-oxoadipate enol-lactonase
LLLYIIGMYYRTTDNQQLYYELHGNPKADKTLVFLNGLSQSTVAWSLMLPAFTDEYQIILLDLIFQGQSDKKGDVRNFDQHATDVHGLISSLNINTVTIIGISYGSLVAQHFALNYPEQIDKLVLLSTFAHKTPYFKAIELAWNHALDVGGYSLMFDVMLPTVLGEGYFEHPLIPIDTLRTSKQTINTEALPLKKLMMATYQREDYRKKLTAIKKPTLVIHGEKDALLSIYMGRQVSEAIEGSRFEIIKDSGHTLNLEAIPETIKLIKEFI